MNVWFVRANGKTSHNNPANGCYVQGESPCYPKQEFNYKDKCLEEGFARYGWPNTGHYPTFEGRLAVNCYTFESIESRYQDYLKGFASICTGDLILMPAYSRQYEVYLGVVLPEEYRNAQRLPTFEFGLNAYYYVPEIPYECAHRVNVYWDKDQNEIARKHYIEGIPWRLAFSRIIKSQAEVVRKAKEVGLPMVTYDDIIRLLKQRVGEVFPFLKSNDQ